jgi:hypothetical protein
VSDPTARILNQISGFVVSQSIAAACQAGVFDVLLKGSLTTSELTRQCRLHPNGAERLVRLLVGEQLLERSGDLLSITDDGALLAENTPGSLKYLALMYAGLMYPAFGRAAHSFATGESAIPPAFAGKNVWQVLQGDPELGRLFNRAMADRSRARASTVASSDVWQHVTHVADIGGGTGTLLATILRSHPHMQGVLFDRPNVVASAGEAFKGIADDRWRTAGGDFFEAVPSGSDAYVLSLILHDWDDDRCGQLLRSIARATVPGNRLLIAEKVLPEDGQPHFVDRSNVIMLLGPGGMERTTDEYTTLLGRNGFEIVRTVAGVHTDLLEAIRVRETITPSASALPVADPAGI